MPSGSAEAQEISLESAPTGVEYVQEYFADEIFKKS